jgi:tRNA threonylcarbamoyl adenosine modification protein YeaZ
MSILALETSTTHGSVAVLGDDGAVRFDHRFVADRTHSSALFSAIEEARNNAGDWNKIVVGLGPGSYAGVRIAISAALGLALTTGAEFLGLPSVATMDVEPRRYAVIGDARRETFYWTLVEAGLCAEGPSLIPAEDLRERLAGMHVPVFASEDVPGFPATLAYPSALRAAHLALAGHGISARGDLEPIYLREPHITRPKAG